MNSRRSREEEEGKKGKRLGGIKNGRIRHDRRGMGGKEKKGHAISYSLSIHSHTLCLTLLMA